jgi:4-hydroxy-2-oxoheptanedioate aldolase
MIEAGDSRFGLWLSSPNIAAAEIAASVGYGMVVLDIEHGSFDLDTLERFIPLLRSFGFEVLAKVLAAERAPIQQALDFGANAVVIPHIGDIEHAKRVCGFAKFPPAGDRSFAGGRTVNYGAPDDAWVAAQDKNTRCYPMIENAASLNDVEKILALDTVDGVFIGPSDLSLRRNRGSYKRSEGDFADLKRVADAARATGKKWILPAWSVEEKRFAIANGVHQMALTMEHGALALGIKDAWAATQSIVSKAA